MKNFLILPLTFIITTGTALSNPCGTPKQLQVPFVNQEINTSDYEGLSVHYNMNATPKLKVVCTLSDFYKGWINYSENGAAKSSNTYGGSQTVIFTNVGPTQYFTETLDQFHADIEGSLLIHETHSYLPANGFVSCSYMPDNLIN